MKRISWSKANVFIDGEEHQRHRFFFDPDSRKATVHDRRGELVASIAVDELTDTGRREVLVSGEGQEWRVIRQGCGCGGG